MHNDARAQQKAAKIVGVAYLFAMAMAIFAESYVRGSLIVAGDAVATAQSIMARSALFRAGIGAEILTFISDTTLIAALYVILGPVNRHLATYAAFLRLVAVALCAAMAAHSFDVLRILSGAEYLGAFDLAQQAALARLSLGAHNAAYGVAFILLGLGSAVFAYLWYRSEYVPRALAVLGIVGSLMLSAGTMAILMMPGARIYPFHMVPLFFFEVGMGLWLLFKGLRLPVQAA